jgi:hypothetical protein
MFWAQSLALLAVWIGYGAVQSRRLRPILAAARSVPSGRRAASAVGMLLGGAAVFFAVLLGVGAGGGLGEEGFALWAWPLVALGGLAFCHLQLLAVARLAVSALDARRASVTERLPDASGTQESLR